MVVAGAIVLGLSVCPVLRAFSQVQMHEILAVHGGYPLSQNALGLQIVYSMLDYATRNVCHLLLTGRILDC